MSYSVSDIKKAFQDIANLGIVDPFYPSELASKLSSWYPKGNIEISSYCTNVYSYSTLTVASDSNLIPENIKENVNILGVVGTLVSEKGIQYYIENGYSGNLDCNCSYVGSYVFYYCSNLNSVSFPVCSYINSNAFYYCSNLTTASFPVCSYIGEYAFRYCYRLLSLYLLSTSITSLYSTNVFQSTPISNYTAFTSSVYGSIYVLASMLSQWKTATNWSSYSSRFVGV